MTYRVPLFFGTLKVKTYPYLRRFERDKKVPVLNVGRLYFVWIGTNSRYQSD